MLCDSIATLSGAISYVILQLLTGKFTKKDILISIIAVLFVLRFAFVFTGTLIPAPIA